MLTLSPKYDSTQSFETDCHPSKPRSNSQEASTAIEDEDDTGNVAAGYAKDFPKIALDMNTATLYNINFIDKKANRFQHSSLIFEKVQNTPQLIFFILPLPFDII